jgi:4-amino-4-deoxy-L-arabinose transferase-like glycosyltransferase
MQLPANAKRSQTYVMLALCGLAFIPRLALILYYTRETPTQNFWTYGYEPSHIAAALVRGYGFSSPFTEHSGPTAWLPPVYPWLIALFYWLFGIFSAKALACLLALNLISATLTVAVVYRIGLRLSTEVAFGGALLWAISPDAIPMSVRIWDISPATLLGALVVLWYLRVIEPAARTRDWVIYGLLWGCAALVSTTLLAMMPLAIAVLLFAHRGRMRKQALMATAIAILITVPWTIRNYREFGRLIPIRGNFGEELWAGNHPGVSGPADESVHPLKDKTELNDYLTMGESRYVVSRQQKARQFIRENPKTFAVLTWERFLSFWSAPLVMDAAWPTICSVLAWIATVLLLWRRESRMIAVPFVAVMIFFPFSYYISHAESYFRSPVEPEISLLAVYAFFAGIALLSARGKTRSDAS